MTCTLHCIRCTVGRRRRRRRREEGGGRVRELKQIKDIRVYLICTSAADPAVTTH